MNFKLDFPILKKYPALAFLDSAASSQKPQVVIDRIKRFYAEENANVHRGIYKLSETSTEEYEQARSIVQKFINAKSAKEIIFTSGTTDSVNLVSHSWIKSNVGKGDTLLVSEMEHHSNFIPWQQEALNLDGVNFEVVKVTENYELDLYDLEKKLKEFKPKLFAITHISNVLGTINPIKNIVELKNRISPETKIFIDAAQSISHIPIDVQDLGIDFLAFSGHKIYGPTGIGVLWGRENELLENMEPFRYGGGMIRKVTTEESTWCELPEKFEAGTPNISGAIGLGEALKYVGSIGFSKIMHHETQITNYLINKFQNINSVKIFGPQTCDNRTGVVSFSIDGIHPHDIAQILANNDVAVRAGHHCAQVLMRNVLKVAATTRASIGLYNDEEDIDRLVEAITKAIKIFK